MAYTCDLEGDGLNRNYNRQVFPADNHFDSETRIWAFTICNEDYRTMTFVSKIPYTRTLPGYYIHNNGTKSNRTLAYHDTASRVPKTIILADNSEHKVKEIPDYITYMNTIRDIIAKCPSEIYFKGYGIHDYDKELIKCNFDRWNIVYDPTTLDKLINFQPKFWSNTLSQVKKGQWLTNEQYLINGIKHNIEDTIQLQQRLQNERINN